MDLQFPGYIAAMSDNGIDAYTKVIGYFLVGHSLNKRYDHVALSIGKRLAIVGILADHLGNLGAHIVLLRHSLHPTNSGNKDFVLHFRMLPQPLFVLVQVVKHGCQLDVALGITWQILDNDILQFAHARSNLPMML